MFAGDEVDAAVHAEFAGPDLAQLHKEWADGIAAIVKEATLELPEDGWMASGGRAGRHSEDFGYMIAEMQHLQRSYPGVNW